MTLLRKILKHVSVLGIGGEGGKDSIYSSKKKTKEYDKIKHLFKLKG